MTSLRLEFLLSYLLFFLSFLGEFVEKRPRLWCSFNFTKMCNSASALGTKHNTRGATAGLLAGKIGVCT